MRKIIKYYLLLFLFFFVFNVSSYGGNLLHKQKSLLDNKQDVEKPEKVTEKNIRKEIQKPIIIKYMWLKNDKIYKRVVDISPPKGYERISVKPGSFAEFLRFLPLKKDKTVYLFNGEKKSSQIYQYEVIDLDIGSKDLQQCADTIMRLRAEFFYGKGDTDNISFNFVNGFRCEYSKWEKGFRVKISGNEVHWVKTKTFDSSYKSFRKYLDVVFNYANTSSFAKELQKVDDINNIKIGDIFIYPGFPGHAVMITDIVQNKKGEKKFLLLQGFMPAQNAYIY